MNSISTQHGDGGQTQLIGGAQVSKADLRVEAYGAIDELGAAMGFARSISGDKEIALLTKEIQRELFLVAGSVADPRALQKQKHDVTPAMTERLTREVHRLESIEGILSDWALTGDHPPAAAYDLARSICRRAERCVVRLRERGEEVSDEVIRYLNRLSDLLWLFGRALELRAGVDSRLRDAAHAGNKFSRAW
ncbi:MAG: cob(I)yrinic acid a,c-diamide adenosyltransferase [Blastocatellia bacterium]|nr:cob(I)yrinic acid a,c-diamide adenosyltransferase [Blastocatellia bacterium]